VLLVPMIRGRVMLVSLGYGGLDDVLGPDDERDVVGVPLRRASLNTSYPGVSDGDPILSLVELGAS
jgi:hypothetical protein